MNIAGMGFTRLIKTFVPGVLLFIIAVGYVEVAATLGRGQYVLLPLFATNVSIAVAVASVAGIMLGVLSNMVVFAWANDRLVRKPFDAAHPWVAETERSLTRRAVHIKRAKDLAPQVPMDAFDAEYLLTAEIPLDKDTFLRESYWYYLEFQMNTALAILVGLPLAVSGAYAYFVWLGLPPTGGVVLGAMIALVLSYMIVWLIQTARLNYRRHALKRISMLIAAVRTAESGVPRAAKGGGRTRHRRLS